MPWSYAWRTSLVNPSCPKARCVAPLTDPVPKASRVTLTPDLPSVTQSVAVPRAARNGRPPVPASTPAASPVFKKLRLEQSGIIALQWAISDHESGPYGGGIPDSRAASVMLLTNRMPLRCGAGWNPAADPEGYPGNPPGAPEIGVPSGPRAAWQAGPQRQL